MSNLLEQVGHTVSMRGLLRRRQAVLIAVSGGLDSLVLLHLLHELSHKFFWRLTVAHLNHQLRGRSSDADERLVIRAAAKLGLPVVSEQAEVKQLARGRKISIEMAARVVRHDFLARTAARLKIPTVALAHHADDQLELFFLRLLRGSGNEGVAGMKWRSPSPANSNIELVRPLLDQPKAALNQFAAGRKIGFREDDSNALLDFQRNRIRHELLPLLRRKYQPALERVLARFIDMAGAESEFVRQAAAEWLNKKIRAPFGKLPVAVQRRCLQLQLFSRGIAVDYELVENLRTRSQCPCTVGTGLTVRLDTHGRVLLEKPKPDRSFVLPGRGHQANKVVLKAELSIYGGAGEGSFGGLMVRWCIKRWKSSDRRKPKAGREMFDADKVGPRIVLRHWQSGDRFQPIGMYSAVKLQDLFTNLKIPREERHQLVVATTGDGTLFWVEKLRIAEPFKISPATIRRLQWQWNRP